MSNKCGTDIDRAVSELKQGHLVAIPTETVYGLAANATDTYAVAQIFEAKKRPSFDPLIVHCENWQRAQEWIAHAPERAHRLAEVLMPGPLTMVLPKNPAIPDLVTSGLDTVAIRIPSHPLTRELLTRLPFPLAAPSANPFGYVSPTSAQHVLDQLQDEVAYVLDGGICVVGLESTIVSITETGWEVLRLGGMDLADIERIAGCSPDAVRLSSSRPEAPGMLHTHYAPKKPVFFGSEADFSALYPNATFVLLTYLQEGKTDLGPSLAADVKYLSRTSDDKEGAAQIFRYLRELEHHPADWIVATPWPEKGLGRAINDRLQRAAASNSLTI